MAAKGRKGWKEESGYHRRSLAENMMYRLKQLGDRLFSREFDRQVAESHVRAAIINQFACLGMPQSVRTAAAISMPRRFPAWAALTAFTLASSRKSTFFALRPLPRLMSSASSACIPP